MLNVMYSAKLYSVKEKFNSTLADPHVSSKLSTQNTTKLQKNYFKKNNKQTITTSESVYCMVYTKRKL